jgi:hypothetical protein
LINTDNLSFVVNRYFCYVVALGGGHVTRLSRRYFCLVS